MTTEPKLITTVTLADAVIANNNAIQNDYTLYTDEIDENAYTKESVHAVLQHIREEIYLAYCLKADDANYEQYKKIKVYIESLMK